MTATVGLRSGISKHWTGSLLDLNCNSPETSSDYLDPSNENPFYVHWRSDESTVLQRLQKLGGNGYVRMTGETSSNGTIYPTDDKQHFDNNGYTDTTNFTPDQIFRLRQLISLLHRNFHHRYGQNNRGMPRHSSGHASHTNPIDAFDLSMSTDSKWRKSPELSEHKLFQGLFDLDPSFLFPNASSFVLITKSKRRHCSSEGDLTFITAGDCEKVANERLFNSSCNLANSPSEQKSHCIKENENSDNQSGKLSESDGPDVCLDVEKAADDDSSTDQTIVSDVYFSTAPMDTTSKYAELPENCYQTCEQEGVQTLKSSSNVTTTDTVKSNVSDDILECTVSKPPTTLNVPSNDSTNLLNQLSSDTSLAKSALSSSQLKEMERENSTVSGSSMRMVKTVSFADEVGQSLTEVFLFRKTEEECLIPEYDDEFDGPFISFLRKPKTSSFGRFSRTRRGFDDISTSNCHSPMSSTYTGMRRPIQNSEFADQGRYLWFLSFVQPAAQYYEFRQRVENACVSLENITLTQPEDYSTQSKQSFTKTGQADAKISSQIPRFPYLSGTIKVKNVHFEKKVWLRVTTNQWVTYKDLPATYSLQLSCGSIGGGYGRFDTFTFQICSADYPCDVRASERIEFAIRYCTGPEGSHGQFWDNNHGQNYVVERRRVEPGWTSPTNSSPSMMGSSPAYNDLSSFTSLDTNEAKSNVHKPYTTDYRPNFAGIQSFTDYRAWEHFACESIYY